MASLLLVEDEPHIASGLSFNLEAEEVKILPANKNGNKPAGNNRLAHAQQHIANAMARGAAAKIPLPAGGST